MRCFTLIIMAASWSAMSATPSAARTPFPHGEVRAQASSASSALMSANHDVGRVGLAIGNDGTLGEFAAGGRSLDWFTGEPTYRGEYPIGSGVSYLFGGALWLGAVVGNDTLVSTGADGWARPGNELHPEEYADGGGIIYRSTLDPSRSTYEGAVSEQDYIAVYRDTCVTSNCVGLSNDPVDSRGHRPLNLEITQRSYAWSYPHADDFVLIDYSIRNIGSQTLHDFFLGLFMDHDIHDLENEGGNGAQDDLVGMWNGSFTYSRNGCEAPVDLLLPWTADNDGDLNQSVKVYEYATGVAGIRLLNIAGGIPQTAFNWWISNGNPALDYGPMARAHVRDFGTGGIGTPEGDRNKYYLLSNGDRDFDQVMTSTIGDFDSVWLPPPDGYSLEYSIGLDVRYLVSSGGIDFEPGQEIPLTVAYVCGENFHTSGANFDNLPYTPDAYLDGLDFSSFLNNGLWAGWVYDNPGVDTDSDGYFGAYQLCGEDTLWYEGDGVPDWRAVTPPAVPEVWLIPIESGLYVRWNGFVAETQIDWASRENLFEGYRVHLSSNGGPSGFACIGSYDVEDYYRYYFDQQLGEWVRSVGRFTLEETRCRYASGGCADESWHPLTYTRQAPLVMTGYPDSILYFERIFANAFRFGLETPFEKRFPDAPRPVYLRPADVPGDSVAFYLTDDGYFKYYEYEMTIEGLLPGQPYWVAVTSQDYGSMVPGAAPLESPVAQSALMARPLGNCCTGFVGNANCDAQDEISLGDITVLIDNLFINSAPLCCLAEADVNQSGGSEPDAGDVSLGDVMILIDYLFITGPSLGLPNCP